MLNILVCVKQVPDINLVKMDPVTGSLIRAGVPAILNPLDANALEAAVRVKEAHGGTVTVITMGPDMAKEALRECLAAGADRAVLLSDRAFANADTLATSYVIVSAAKMLGDFDLIFCGKESLDGATGAQALFRVKLPMVMPSITICTFLTLTNSFKLFDQNLSLTGGEPAKASQMLALNIYDTFYQRSGAQWKGIGQAKAVVFFLLVIVIALIQLYFTRRKEVQQ